MTADADPPPLDTLTDREKEVARLVREGHGYGAIGLRLGCSPRTVESHVLSIAHKIPGRATPLRRVMIWANRTPGL